MKRNVLTSNQGKENKSFLLYQETSPSHRAKHTDCDSRVVSSRTTTMSQEVLLRMNSLDENDEVFRRASDASSFTSFSTTTPTDELRSGSMTSSRSSGMNFAMPSMSMLAISSNQSLAAPLNLCDGDEKPSKGRVKNFFRRIFGSTSTPATPTTTTNNLFSIDLVHGTAYPPMSPLSSTQGPLRLFIIRHGERLDRYYSSLWLQQAFDKDGNYCRFSPILPETVPFRASVRDFDLDPPLTYKGLKDALYTGTRLKEKDIHIHYCYSSPALRCIQTAAKVIEGLQLQNKLKIRIEPGLFECTAWYTADESGNLLTMPKFLTKKELIENKYPIERSYHEQMNIAEISQLETELEFYGRSHAVAAAILKMHENELIQHIQQGHVTPQHHVHILFIAHAPTLETCTRKLCGGKFRPDSLGHVIRNVDFLTMTVIEKKDNNASKWIFRRNSFYGDEF